MRKVEIPDSEAFTIQPGDFVLAATRETLELDDDIIGRLEGRSSLARIGIIVYSTVGLFDPDWIGTVTLEVGNLGQCQSNLILVIGFVPLSSSSYPHLFKFHIKENWE